VRGFGVGLGLGRWFGIGMPKRRKNSSISSSVSEPARAAFARSVVRMPTTAGPTFSTNSVKSGRPCAPTGVAASALVMARPSDSAPSQTRRRTSA
jgi:hypothetical protein